jgi:hypothetical protein
MKNTNTCHPAQGRRPQAADAGPNNKDMALGVRPRIFATLVRDDKIN